MLAGMLLAVCTYKPLFSQLLKLTDLSAKTEITSARETRSTLLPIKGSQDMLRTTVNKTQYDDGTLLTTTTKDTLYQDINKTTHKPEIKISKKVSDSSYWKMIFIVFIMILYVTMVYGPIAAFLVELFPTRIRYTSMSLPYHIGNGVFGGLTPFIATLLATSYASDKLAGLMYPIIVASISLVIGALYLANRIDPDVSD